MWWKMRTSTSVGVWCVDFTTFGLLFLTTTIGCWILGGFLWKVSLSSSHKIKISLLPLLRTRIWMGRLWVWQEHFLH